jgi:Tfp pilus assembly protein PilN
MQHLNLYDQTLRPPKVWLTPLRLMLAVAMVLGLMALAGAWLRRDAARWEAEAAAQQAELQKLTATMLPPQAADADLPGLRQQLAQASQLSQAMQAGGSRTLPAEVLTALALAAPGDVWITAASWQAEPRELALEGGLLDPNRLPDYLRRLERQPAFQGQTFAQLQLAPWPDTRHHQFALRSRAKEGGR